MELKDLVGKRILSGVDYIPSRMKCTDCKEYGNDILFCLDGINYLMTEDEDDGYRSYMTELEVTSRKIENMFPGQEVICEYIEKGSYDLTEKDILQMKSLDGKEILRVGTDYNDAQYPYAIFEYYPENMGINKER